MGAGGQESARITVTADVEEAVKELNELRSRMEALQRPFREAERLPGPVAQKFDELAGTARDLRTELGQAPQEVTQFGEALEEPLTAGQQLTGVFEALDDKLGEFGLTLRSVTVALGAGLAGGITAFLRVAVIAVRSVISFIQDIISEERRLERETFAAFGAASDHVRQFANETAGVLRTTRTELTDTINSFGQMANLLRIPRQEAAEFAQSMAVLATGIVNLAPAARNSGEAMGLMQQAIEGSQEALAGLGIQIVDFEALARQRFGQAADTLTPYQRQLLLVELLHQRISQNLEAAEEDVRSIWGRMRDDIGQVVVVLNDLTTRALEALDRQAQRVGSSLGEAFVSRLPFVGVHLAILTRLLGGGSDAQKSFADATNEAAQAAHNQQRALALAVQGFLENTSAVDSARDAFRRLAQARVDGAHQMRDAQLRLSRAIEDAAHRELELRIRIARQIEDANRDIIRAQQDLVRAQEDNVRRLEDAALRFEESQIQSFRAVRNAQERLEDHNRDSARRIEDLQRRVSRAREREVKDITEAIIAVEEAQRKGDAEAENRARRNLARLQQERTSNTQLEDALRDLDRAREDAIRRRERLERSLVETQLDAARRNIKAQRDMQRAQVEAHRAIENALRRLQDAQTRQARAAQDAARQLARLAVENQRAITDAQRALENVARSMQRAMDDATRAIERMARALGLTAGELHFILQFSPQVIKFYRALAKEAGPFASLFGIPPMFRQHGGRFDFGQPYIVGEAGPELIVPDSSGRVLSNQELLRLISDHGMGGGPTININQVAANPYATAFAVNARLARGVN